MKASELREKSTEDLQAEITELNDELFKLRFQNATHSLEDTSQLTKVRRNIARAKTILRERELAEERN